MTRSWQRALTLFSVFLRMLDENALPAEIKELIRDGHWAQGAVRRVIEKHTALFAQMEDDYLRERVSDLKDLGRRILAMLTRRRFESP